MYTYISGMPSQMQRTANGNQTKENNFRKAVFTRLVFCLSSLKVNTPSHLFSCRFHTFSKYFTVPSKSLSSLLYHTETT
jgi:hypothetical protein